LIRLPQLSSKTKEIIGPILFRFAVKFHTTFFEPRKLSLNIFGEESSGRDASLASFRRETPILQKTLLAQQRFQRVTEPRLIFNGVAQAIVVAGSGIEWKSTLDVNLH
jgi:hypothetical protein